MKSRTLTLVVGCLLILGGCGGETGNDTGKEDKSVPGGNTVTAPVPPTTAIGLADGLKAKVSSITKTVQITEDNDPNDKIGRPNGYKDAAVIYDRGTDPCNDDNFGAECGATIEIWPNAMDAKDRSEFIQKSLKDFDGTLGTEYHYLRGAQLLRVAGDVKPSVAKQYEATWKTLG